MAVGSWDSLEKIEKIISLIEKPLFLVQTESGIPSPKARTRDVLRRLSQKEIRELPA